MFSTIVKCICSSVLILAIALRFDGGAGILLQLVVCGGAAFVMVQAVRSAKYLWVTAFVLIAVCFNPVFPIVLSRAAALPITLACLLMFLASLRYVNAAPRMSLATITDLPARGESL